MNYKKLAISILLPQLAGIAGSFFTIKSINNWYQYLEKPFFSPPNYIFGPVWSVLYLLMGLSVYFLWEKSANNKHAKETVDIFWIHLFFNFIWSILFFGMRNVLFALVDILIIWIFIIALIIRSWSDRKVSAILFIPYLLWVSFATVLNYYILILNK